ncbi:NACHT domain-containing protein [Photobacterium kishitanii]|uniref:NACHT domain-containing protein n=1 Tax=Photobacterium kishitanii TaxID=318456 RepID=UPI00071AEE3D|nr:NACHT domain-containing protein [Photobacterium kishitanii]
MEIATTLTTMVLKQAVTHFTKKLLEKDWSESLASGKGLLEQLSDSNITERYVEKYVSKHLRIRTLHSAESDIFIDEIYTPLTLVTVKDNDELVVNDGFTLEYSRVVNIIGIAGQGKSTILRKLFLEEINKKNKFPFFIELRRVNDDGIFYYLKQNLEDIGLNVTESSLTELLQSNNIILLLDGFDEVMTKNRKEILSEIIKIRTRYNCSIIVTSRPDTEICNESNIINLKVKKLASIEINNIIQKLDSNNESPEIADLVNKNKDLEDTLVSPILVNLLFVCYPYLDVIPESITDFYSKLFLTLYSRHDKIKNFNREKYSKITPIVASNIFDALCYNSFNKELFEFTDTTLVKQILSALKYNNICKDQVDNIKHDIITITCLIQKDGFDRYVYLHKSVQEYHAASFISNLPYDYKKKFYLNLSAVIDHLDKYDNIICFLRDIDKVDFESMLVINSLNKYNLGDINSDNKDMFLSNCIENVFKGKIVHICIKNGDDSGCQRAFDSLVMNNILSLILLFTKAGRFNSNIIDDNLMSNIGPLAIRHNGILTREFLGKYKELKADDLLIFSDNKNSFKYYNIPLIDCYHLIGKLDEIKDLIRQVILSFYQEVYIPILQRDRKRSETLDVDFDF